MDELPIASNCNILIADSEGEMVVAECNPVEINIRMPEENKNGRKSIITVNHFTSERMQKYDVDSGEEYFSKERYQSAYDALMNKKNTDVIDFSKNILSGKYGFMCQYHKKMDFDTIWSSIFILRSGAIFLAEGNPGRAKFKTDNRLMNIIKSRS